MSTSVGRLQFFQNPTNIAAGKPGALLETIRHITRQFTSFNQALDRPTIERDVFDRENRNRGSQPARCIYQEGAELKHRHRVFIQSRSLVSQIVLNHAPLSFRRPNHRFYRHRLQQITERLIKSRTHIVSVAERNHRDMG